MKMFVRFTRTATRPTHSSVIIKVKFLAEEHADEIDTTWAIDKNCGRLKKAMGEMAENPKLGDRHYMLDQRKVPFDISGKGDFPQNTAYKIINSPFEVRTLWVKN